MRLLTIDRPRTRICKCWCNRQRTKSFGKRGRESDGLKRDVPVRKNPYKGINLNKKTLLLQRIWHKLYSDRIFRGVMSSSCTRKA
ncbi:hypothetical protein TF3313_0854 [Tannerella forsythia 3313]|nr:hypothetical protein TF3313_0854 [Tannerella forsythia 3313]